MRADPDVPGASALARMVRAGLVGVLLVHAACAQMVPDAAISREAPPPGDSHAAETDRFLDLLDDHGLAHGSIAISVRGVPAYRRAIGSARMGPTGGIPATIDSHYRIGSVSKLFTAVLVFQLIEDGVLSLDDRLGEYMPGIPGAERVTVRDLLYHRSRLPNYSEAQDFAEWKYLPKTKEELIRIVTALGPPSEGAPEYAYSNTNYLLLSFVIEAVSGRPYPRILEDRVLTPLGLHGTYFEAMPDSSRRDSRSYANSDGTWREQRDDVAANHVGAGGLVSTPSDLRAFLDALVGGRLVSAGSLELMTSFAGEYGMGLFLFSSGGSAGFGHGGRINEYYTRLIHFPRDELTIAYAANGIIYPPTDILDAIVRIWTDEEFALPDFSSFAIDPMGLERYAGTYRSGAMGLTVVARRVGTRLMLESAGTDFEAQPYGLDRFANLRYGYFFQFDPDTDRLVVKERDNVYELKRRR